MPILPTETPAPVNGAAPDPKAIGAPSPSLSGQPTGQGAAGSSPTDPSGTSPLNGSPTDPVADLKAKLEAKLESLAKADLTQKEKERLSDVAIRRFEEKREVLDALDKGDIKAALKAHLKDKYNPGELLMDFAIDAAPAEELDPIAAAAKAAREATLATLKEREDAAAEAEKARKAEEESKATQEYNQRWEGEKTKAAEFLRAEVAAGKYPLVKVYDADPMVDHVALYDKVFIELLDANEKAGKSGPESLPSAKDIWDHIEGIYEKRRAFYVAPVPQRQSELERLEAERGRPVPPPVLRSPAQGEHISGAEEARRRLREADHEAAVRASLGYGR